MSKLFSNLNPNWIFLVVLLLGMFAAKSGVIGVLYASWYLILIYLSIMALQFIYMLFYVWRQNEWKLLKEMEWLFKGLCIIGIPVWILLFPQVSDIAVKLQRLVSGF
jgi:hypothetical protein